jgi:hypothetical protein
MANIFQRSFNDLLQELRTEAALKSGEPDPTAGRYGQPSSFLSPTQGRLLQAGEPAPTPYVPASSAQAPATPANPVWNPNAPSPQAPPSRGTTGTWNPSVPAFAGGAVTPTMQPTGNVSGNVAPNMPPVIPGPSMTPTGQVTGAPTGTSNQSAPTTQQGGGQPFVSMGEQGLNVPNKVTTKIDRPTHSETHSIQAKPPKQTGDAAAAQGGAAPGGAAPGPASAPAVPTAPAVRPAQPVSQAIGPWTYGAPPGVAAQGQGQNVNLQVPAHPGLLERIGQTISHFFGGTLGQHQQPVQPTSPYRPGYGPPENNALSGVSRALASGRQQVATRGGTTPTSAPAPAPPGFSTPASFMGEEGESTLGAGTPPPGATQIITDPKTGKQYWADAKRNIIQ